MQRTSDLYRKYLDILHLYYTDYTERGGKLLYNIAPLSAAARAKLIIKQLLKLLVSFPGDLMKYFKIEKQSDVIWLYTVSKNNSDVLKHFHKNDRLRYKTRFVSTQQKIPSFGIDEVTFYPQSFRLLFIFRYFRIYKHLKRVNPERTKRLSSLIFSVTGMLESSTMILKKSKPRAIIFTNDINPACRALLWAAKDLNIPVIYLQHASVTPFFPPLLFDLSLLEGKAAMDQYLHNGTLDDQRIRLVGSAKFDAGIKRANTSATISRIGICSNLLDSQEKVSDLIRFIRAQFKDIILTYRPHPRQKEIGTMEPGVVYSDPLSESVLDFLAQQDLIIANNSNILLEAAMLNVVALRYTLSDTVLPDPYGFVRNKVADDIADHAALQQYLQQHAEHKPQVKHRAKYYNEAMDAPFEGSSASYASNYINELLGGVS